MQVVALVVSVGGMLVTALMLGIVSETISDKIEDLKKGTSDVLEDNHRCDAWLLHCICSALLGATHPGADAGMDAHCHAQCTRLPMNYLGRPEDVWQGAALRAANITGFPAVLLPDQNCCSMCAQPDPGLERQGHCHREPAVQRERERGRSAHRHPVGAGKGMAPHLSQLNMRAVTLQA